MLRCQLVEPFLRLAQQSCIEQEAYEQLGVFFVRRLGATGKSSVEDRALQLSAPGLAERQQGEQSRFSQPPFVRFIEQGLRVVPISRQNKDPGAGPGGGGSHKPSASL